MSSTLEITTLGAGCFWCTEAVFAQLCGVERTLCGYAGGQSENPSYPQVCSGATGHAEVVRLHFDPALISFADLLYVFWRSHDPTTPNRQGADLGTQYRSAIFYHSEEQKAIAERSRAQTERSELWPDPIVTEIAPCRAFYAAEEYHQDYYRLNPNQPYCRMVVDPKLRKFKEEFAGRLKEEVRSRG